MVETREKPNGASPGVHPMRYIHVVMERFAGDASGRFADLEGP